MVLCPHDGLESRGPSTAAPFFRSGILLEPRRGGLPGRRLEWKLDPSESYVASHVAQRILREAIIEHREAITDPHDRGQSYHILRPFAGTRIEHDGFIRRIPRLRIL